MSLSRLKSCLFKPGNNLLYPSLLSSSLQRLSAVAHMSSRRRFKRASDTKPSEDNVEIQTLRKPGMSPDVDPNAIHPAVVRYTQPKMKLKLQGIDLTKYTHVPIPYPKTGGRNWHGQVQNKRVGGGAKQRIRLVDYTRNAISEKEPLVERVLSVDYDPLRSADLALVASGNNKRWIIASDNMKKGDIIKSHIKIPQYPVAAKTGDAHPLGALPVGAVVHNIEMYQKEGGSFARAAGASGTIKLKVNDKVTVTLPSGRDVQLSKFCMATSGKASNIDHYKEHIGSAQRSRHFGIRPCSGLFKKKTGYHGRKMKRVKPVITYEKKTRKPLHEMFDS